MENIEGGWQKDKQKKDEVEKNKDNIKITRGKSIGKMNKEKREMKENKECKQQYSKRSEL